MFTEIARLTSNLCPLDLLGDSGFLKKMFVVSFSAPHMVPLWGVFLLKLCLAVEEKKFFLRRRCKLRNAFPVQ